MEKDLLESNGTIPPTSEGHENINSYSQFEDMTLRPKQTPLISQSVQQNENEKFMLCGTSTVLHWRTCF